jgi:putative oxidoreductase
VAAITARFEQPVYAALRFVAGAMFSLHGMQKVLGWFTTRPSPAVGSQLWIGGVIELVAGILVAVGLFTRPAAFIASGMMAVAYIQFHWKLTLTGFKWLPVMNGGELAALYCFVFLFIAARGPGIASLDRVLDRQRRR